ncbi:lectin-domain protein [Gregarina niphandrodes]|uniref:Lectin-domain protein n=1 Tax=Gregarina niphandrodes TaxID=110365 RepID=A0A023AZP2_GRENI|nr:lectin-domain protein [Gregarina niphandrodes]EZG43775.1 lectin-domain protein [Gregarina niphandrodes]|eukprot:XP_011134615.1 lectin-domain protein [Gregarina niphandrodes]
MLHYRTTAAFGLLLSCQLCEGVQLDAYDLEASAWVYSGSAGRGAESSVALVAEVDDVGAMWHRDELAAGKFEVQIDFEVAGEISSPFTALDGFALWVANNVTEEAMTAVAASDAQLYGFRPNFSGFAVFFSTTTRSGSLRPSVSVLFNDGATELKSTTDVPTDFGLYWNYGPLAGSPSSTFSLLITTDGPKAHVSVRRSAGDNWKQVAGVTGVFDVAGRLGISAANNRLQTDDGERSPATILVRQLAVQSNDPQYVADYDARQALLDNQVPAPVPVGGKAKAQKEAQVAPQNDAAAPSGDLSRYDSQLDLMMRQIIDINQRQQKMSAAVDNLMKQFATDNKGPANNVQKALEDIRNDLLIKREERLVGGDVENDRIKNLQENAASLENTVRQATAVTTYLAGGLGVCFIGFGTLIYRRMREMEKKHFL